MMRQAGRLALILAYQRLGTQFMAWVAGGKLRRHRIGRNIGALALQPRHQRIFVQRLGLPTPVVVATSQHNKRIAPQRLAQAVGV